MEKKNSAISDYKRRYNETTKEDYSAYMSSSTWREKADRNKQNAGYKCTICGRDNNLVTHHKTYDNIFEEKDDDLQCLCRSCHIIIHEYLDASNNDIETSYGEEICKNNGYLVSGMTVSWILDNKIEMGYKERSVYFCFMALSYGKGLLVTDRISINEIASRSGMARMSAIRAMDWLKENDFIEVIASNSPAVKQKEAYRYRLVYRKDLEMPNAEMIMFKKKPETNNEDIGAYLAWFLDSNLDIKKSTEKLYHIIFCNSIGKYQAYTEHLSIADLARLANQQKSTVQLGLKSLKQLGLIDKVKTNNPLKTGKVPYKYKIVHRSEIGMPKFSVELE